MQKFDRINNIPPFTALIVLPIVLSMLNACSDFRNGPGTMLYEIHSDSAGPVIGTGDFIGFTVTERTEEDSILYSSCDYGRPSFMYCGNAAFEGDFTTALKLLSAGDSATIKIELDAMVKAGKARPVTHGRYLVYNVKIRNVLSKGDTPDSIFNRTVDDFLCQEGEKFKSIEVSEIRQFIIDRHLQPDTTATGLMYEVSEKGKGQLRGPGDSVDVKFITRLLTGKIVDGSYPQYSPEQMDYIPEIDNNIIRWSEGVGSRFYMPGFNEAMGLFPAGTKVKLILPSTLVSEDEAGRKGIPPYVPLEVDLEIINIVPHNKYLAEGTAVPKKQLHR